MRLRSLSVGIERLRDIREDLRSNVAPFEQNARPCAACPDRGACCRDEHFVNVRVGKLEAAAIRAALAEAEDEIRDEVLNRARDAVAKYDLEATPDATYACPLYSRDAGCLVHKTAKPLPCIAHACYESLEDLPPESLLDNAEVAAARLESRVYGSLSTPRSIPLAIL